MATPEQAARMEQALQAHDLEAVLALGQENKQLLNTTFPYHSTTRHPNGNNVQYPPFFVWIENDCSILEIEQLMTAGTDLHTHHDEGTALHLAAHTGNIKTVGFLLDQRVEIEREHNGFTALHMAASQGHSEIIGLLIEYGANPRRRANDLFKMDPLTLAFENNHIDAMRILIEHQVEIEPLLDMIGKRELNDARVQYLKMLTDPMFIKELGQHLSPLKDPSEQEPTWSDTFLSLPLFWATPTWQHFLHHYTQKMPEKRMAFLSMLNTRLAIFGSPHQPISAFEHLIEQERFDIAEQIWDLLSPTEKNQFSNRDTFLIRLTEHYARHMSHTSDHLVNPDHIFRLLEKIAPESMADLEVNLEKRENLLHPSKPRYPC